MAGAFMPFINSRMGVVSNAPACDSAMRAHATEDGATGRMQLS